MSSPRSCARSVRSSGQNGAEKGVETGCLVLDADHRALARSFEFLSGTLARPLI